MRILNSNMIIVRDPPQFSCQCNFSIRNNLPIGKMVNRNTLSEKAFALCTSCNDTTISNSSFSNGNCPRKLMRRKDTPTQMREAKGGSLSMITRWWSHRRASARKNGFLCSIEVYRSIENYVATEQTWHRRKEKKTRALGNPRNRVRVNTHK